MNTYVLIVHGLQTDCARIAKKTNGTKINNHNKRKNCAIGHFT